ncbi:835_t:CDS:1 [Cetraspora pellucida]|uniref:835_t:CDS:1 n=1 Tax=Cetraspora pellucida TaxID=1433469 RepID=A0ACA9LNE8_9GLOM|nr:835_t:CDS:1 [Cetraspora pellucida]
MDIDTDNHSTYTSEIEYTSDLRQPLDIEHLSDVELSATREESVEEPSAKKIHVNLVNPSKRPSYVWKYFKEIDGHDVCKIIVLQKGEETDCNKTYKHDGGTENMKTHL